MAIKDMRIAFTTDASGDAVVYGEASIRARLLAVMYDYGDAATGADLTLTTDQYAVVESLFVVADLGVADAIWYPRHILHNNANGVVLVGANGGDREPCLIIGRPKITIAQGGNAKSGAFILIYEE